MIILEVYGLDEFVVGEVSKDLTHLLASVYECHDDDINFVATNNMIFHKGVEQTSWHGFIRVNAPMKLQVLQNEAARIIISAFEDVLIHMEIIFDYYPQEHHIAHENKDYPKYMSEDNMVEIGDDHDRIRFHEDEEEDFVEGEEIFTGNIFQDFDKKLNN